MNVVSFVSALHRFWWLGLSTLAVCIIGGALFAYGPEERFEATTTVVVLPSEDLGSNIQGIRFVLPSLSAQVQTPEAFDAVQASLPPALQDSAWDVEVTTDPESLLLFVRSESADRDLVVPVANRFAQQIITQQASDRLVEYSVLEPAATVNSTAGARSVILVGSIALGIIGGILAMLTAHALSPRVVRADDVRRLGLPMLAEVPNTPELPERPREIFSDRAMAPLSEAYERLRIGLDARRTRGRPTTAVAICAIGRDEGTTTVTANLAWTTASVGQPVTVIDANLREPALHRRFGLPNVDGLASSDPVREPKGIPHVADMPALSVVAAGVSDRHPSEPVLANLPPLVGDLGTTGDLVLIDTPPIGVAPEAVAVASTCRAVVLVVRANRHSPADLERASQDLGDAGAEILGVVINRTLTMPKLRGRRRTATQRVRSPRAGRSRVPAPEGDGRVVASGRRGGGD